MRCKCTRGSCHFTIVSPALLKAWENLRLEYGKPLYITSGYRCQGHNEDQAHSVPNSRHTVGNALDISILNTDTSKLLELAEKYFEFIKVYPTFVHVDVRGN